MRQVQEVYFALRRIWRHAASKGMWLLFGLVPLLAACGTGPAAHTINQNTTNQSVSLFITTACDTLHIINPTNGGTVRGLHTQERLECIVDRSPTAAHGLVYVGGKITSVTDFGDDGLIYAFDIATGQEKWKFIIPGRGFAQSSAVETTPAVGNGLVYVGSDDGQLRAIDALTGATKWHFATQGAVRSSPILTTDVSFEDTVIFGSSDKHVYALNALTGALKWSFTTQGPVTTKPAIGLQGLVLVTDATTLYGLNPKDGTLKWSFAIPAGEGKFSAPEFGNIAGKFLAFVGTSVGVLAVDNVSGTKVWEKRLGAPVVGAPFCSCKTASAETLFVNASGFDSPAGVYALNPADGSVIWQALIGGGESQPTQLNGLVFATIKHNPSDQLVALNSSTGKVQWRFGTGLLTSSSFFDVTPALNLF